MDKILTLWTGSGLFNIAPGQVIMILVCLGLLFLAIRKGFEPLLLVPIGFGGILANIPEAGLALSAAENAIHAAKPDVLVFLAGALDVVYQAGQVVTPEIKSAFKAAYSSASSTELAMVNNLAADVGYGNGMLYNFYLVIIGSTVGPLLIFMGVGAMTDFGPLLANPKTLLLGAAAQFGIFWHGFGCGSDGLAGYSGLHHHGGGSDWYYRRRRWTNVYLRIQRTGSASTGCDCGLGLRLHGSGAADSATHYESADHEERTRYQDVPVTPGEQAREDRVPVGGADCGGFIFTRRCSTAGYVLLW